MLQIMRNALCFLLNPLPVLTARRCAGTTSPAASHPAQAQAAVSKGNNQIRIKISLLCLRVVALVCSFVSAASSPSCLAVDERAVDLLFLCSASPRVTNVNAYNRGPPSPVRTVAEDQNQPNRLNISQLQADIASVASGAGLR